MDDTIYKFLCKVVGIKSMACERAVIQNGGTGRYKMWNDDIKWGMDDTIYIFFVRVLGKKMARERAVIQNEKNIKFRMTI